MPPQHRHCIHHLANPERRARPGSRSSQDHPDFTEPNNRSSPQYFINAYSTNEHFINLIVQAPIISLHLTGNSVFYQLNRGRLTFLIDKLGLDRRPRVRSQALSASRQP
jgi:hypothetical protein